MVIGMLAQVPTVIVASFYLGQTEGWVRAYTSVSLLSGRRGW